jgi:hypothetical protein
MSAPVYLTTIILLFGAILAIVAIRYRALGQQAQAKLADAQEWRDLAERAAAAEARTAEALVSVLASVETVLKDVG